MPHVDLEPLVVRLDEQGRGHRPPRACSDAAPAGADDRCRAQSAADGADGIIEAPDLLTRTLAEHQPSVAASSCAKAAGDVCPGDKSSDGPSSACGVYYDERGFRTHVYGRNVFHKEASAYWDRNDHQKKSACS